MLSPKLTSETSTRNEAVRRFIMVRTVHRPSSYPGVVAHIYLQYWSASARSSPVTLLARFSPPRMPLTTAGRSHLPASIQWIVATDIADLSLYLLMFLVSQMTRVTCEGPRAKQKMNDGDPIEEQDSYTTLFEKQTPFPSGYDAKPPILLTFLTSMVFSSVTHIKLGIQCQALLIWTR